VGFANVEEDEVIGGVEVFFEFGGGHLSNHGGSPVAWIR
jgi:hypothetical protein